MKFSSTPAWSFAGKKQLEGQSLGPGPGHYELKKYTDFNGDGFSLPKAERKGMETKNGVGPGQYNFDVSSFRKDGASFKGKRSTLLK